MNIQLKGDIICAASLYGNKIHLYSLKDYQLKHCFVFGEMEIQINSCIFDKKGKYLSFLVNKSEIFIINLDQDENDLCECEEFDDNNILLLANRKSIISGIFTTIKVFLYNLIYSMPLMRIFLCGQNTD